MAKNVRVRPVPAVTRAVAVLRLLARSRVPLTLKVIAESLELVPSTALHILRALVAEKLLQVEEHTKRYRLGVGLLPLARAVLEHSDFPKMVRPILEDLSTRYSVTAVAAEVRLHVDVGSRFPALISATGRCVAAFSKQPWSEIEKRFRAMRWQNGPSYTVWRKEVELTRRHGFNIDRRNYIAGLTIAAVPVLDSRGAITHAISAVGISSQLGRARALALARDMRAAAGALAAQTVAHA